MEEINYKLKCLKDYILDDEETAKCVIKCLDKCTTEAVKRATLKEANEIISNKDDLITETQGVLNEIDVVLEENKGIVKDYDEVKKQLDNCLNHLKNCQDELNDRKKKRGKLPPSMKSTHQQKGELHVTQEESVKDVRKKNIQEGKLPPSKKSKHEQKGELHVTQEESGQDVRKKNTREGKLSSKKENIQLEPVESIAKFKKGKFPPAERGIAQQFVERKPLSYEKEAKEATRRLLNVNVSYEPQEAREEANDILRYILHRLDVTPQEIEYTLSSKDRVISILREIIKRDIWGKVGLWSAHHDYRARILPKIIDWQATDEL